MSFSNKFTFRNQLIYLTGTEGSFTSEEKKTIGKSLQKYENEGEA